jgi:sulfite reductase (NADPH) hemoprotein beta-component
LVSFARSNFSGFDDFFPLPESVNEREILSILRPMIKRYASERDAGERFGDWTIRAGYISPTIEGKLWYEGAGGEGINTST